MTKEEFAVFASALKTYYPREALFPNKQALELWYLQLSDIPYNVAENVLNSWVALNKYSPAISDLREQAFDLMYGKIPDWGEAWGEVVSALGRFGIAGEYRAMSTFGKYTLEAVNRIGYRNLCRSSNQATDRANFRDIYEHIAGQARRERLIPQPVREEAERLYLGESDPVGIEEQESHENDGNRDIGEIIAENLRRALGG